MRRLLYTTALLAVLQAAPATGAVPFWGARTSSPIGTPAADLEPGEWYWGGLSKGWGPMAVIVSLTEQRAYAYRNGILIGISTVSTGKPGHETPTGVFTILQKDKDHRSNLYNSAPMPYQQRLTWDGVALHAGGLPGYPESHGCVHLPSEFARLLFENSNMGMVVVISKAGVSPDALVHPQPLSPIDPGTGADVPMQPLASGETYSWHPESSAQGPISMVLSDADQQLVVYRNGVEIGRARARVHDLPPDFGTQVYLAGQGFLPGTLPGLPDVRMPNWLHVAVNGDATSGETVAAQTIGKVEVPPDFLRQLVPQIMPGAALVVTTQSVMASTTGRAQQVIDADPPEQAAN
ncbi:L,D-transpeptidase [[Pseudomonas] boreopolis]|uniref:L,D-transpeptidase n=1 Tax=Xanthomonas boreopolis TaxID=86183 RepID=UPI003D428897